MAKSKLKNRTPFANAIDKEIYEKLQKYHSETNIPISKILDESLKMFLEKKEPNK